MKISLKNYEFKFKTNTCFKLQDLTGIQTKTYSILQNHRNEGNQQLKIPTQQTLNWLHS